MSKTKFEPLGLFTKTILGSLLFATVLNAIISSVIEPFFVLNENQLLYLLSSMAQIIGGYSD